jgi:UDP-N-acetyl-D-mannosaminuronate dehydrogenase
LLRKKPYLDKESLKDLAIDELKTLGIDLNARRVEKLNRRIKKILNDEK